MLYTEVVIVQALKSRVQLRPVHFAALRYVISSVLPKKKKKNHCPFYKEAIGSLIII
jgi:hypothetical protein